MNTTFRAMGLLITLGLNACVGPEGCASSPRTQQPGPADMALEDLAAPDLSTSAQEPKAQRVRLRHVWSVDAFCKGTSDESFDAFTAHDVFVHTQRPLSHEEALSIHIDAQGPHTPPTGIALVSLDVETGEERSCIPIPRQTRMSIMRYDHERRVVYYTHREEAPAPEPSLPPIDYQLSGGLIGLDVDTGERTFSVEQRYNSQALDATDLSELALAFHKTQAIVKLSNTQLTSLDASTGEVRWTLTPEELGEPNLWQSTLHTPTSSKLFLSSSATRRLYELNERGQATLRYSINAARTLQRFIILEDAVALEEYGDGQFTTKLQSSWEGKLIAEEPNCGWSLTLGDKRVGCIKDRAGEQPRIIALGVDGSRVERTLPTPNNASHATLSEVIALSPSHIATLVVGQRKTEAGASKRVLSLYVLDLDQPALEPAHLEVSAPTYWDAGWKRLLFTRSGMLIIMDESGYHGIKTNLLWTDRGPAPNGALLGDEQNLGYAP